MRVLRWRTNREFEMLERNGREVLRINAQLARLLDDHHTVGIFDGVLVGDKCPVCTADGVLRPEPLVSARLWQAKKAADPEAPF